MKKSVDRRALRTKAVKFKPNRDYLNKAIEEYLANGGKVTKLEFDEKSYQSFMQTPESPSAVDDFLNGTY
jgi:hypothetical protein